MICGSEQGIGGPGGEQSLPVNSEVRQYNLHMCMANHLEALALSSLPWHFGVTAKTSSSQAQGSDIRNNHSDGGLASHNSETSTEPQSSNAVNMATIAWNAADEGEQDLDNTISTWNKHIDQVKHEGQGVEKAAAADKGIKDGEKIADAAVSAVAKEDDPKEPQEETEDERLEKDIAEIEATTEEEDEEYERNRRERRRKRRWKSFSPPASEVMTHPPQYDTVTSPTHGLADYFASDADDEEVGEEKEDAKGEGRATGVAVEDTPRIFLEGGGHPMNIQVRGLFTFESKTSEQLSLQRGDIIDVIEMGEDGWWTGTKNGVVGKFPSYHVERIEETSGAQEDSDVKQVVAAYEGHTAATVRQVRAPYSFRPSEPDELAFEKGDIIEVTESVYKDWWRGRVKRVIGIFPLNYVERIEDTATEARLPMSPLMAARSSLDPLVRPGNPPPPPINSPHAATPFIRRSKSGTNSPQLDTGLVSFTFRNSDDEALEALMTHTAIQQSYRAFSRRTLLFWTRVLEPAARKCSDLCSTCTLVTKLTEAFNYCCGKTSKRMKESDLERALGHLGFRLSTEYVHDTYNSCVQNFSFDDTQGLSYDMFCFLVTVIHVLTEPFKQFDSDRDGWATFSL